MPQQPVFQLLIAHSQPLLSAGLAAVFRQDPGFEVHVQGVDRLEVIEAGVDVVVADRQGAAMLWRRPDDTALSALAFSRILIVNHQAGGAEMPVAFQRRVWASTPPGTSVEALVAEVRLLAEAARRFRTAPGFE